MDGRIKSGHDNWRCSNMSHRPSPIETKSEPNSRWSDQDYRGYAEVSPGML